DDARAIFERDRHSYYLDAELANVSPSASLSDDELPALLDHFDSRQVLHVAFGTILVGHGAAIQSEIDLHAAKFRSGLESHFVRHLAPFV
ncbi:tagaturonate epimerase family protein, partial [Escherichia coli]|uniref:tagaturonate epimerase family protein n=1 Tax=Escherichia coli TaxID=562 RepID=UPI0039BE506C